MRDAAKLTPKRLIPAGKQEHLLAGVDVNIEPGGEADAEYVARASTYSNSLAEVILKLGHLYLSEHILNQMKNSLKPQPNPFSNASEALKELVRLGFWTKYRTGHREATLYCPKIQCQASFYGGCIPVQPCHPKPQTLLHEEMEISKYITELGEQQQIQENWNAIAQTMMTITSKRTRGKPSNKEMQWREALLRQGTLIKRTQAFMKKMSTSLQATAVSATDSLGSTEVTCLLYTSPSPRD